MAPKKASSYYKTVAGVKYDRGLLEHAEKCAADGQVSLDEAKKLWVDAMDGPGVTKIERRTLEYALKEFKFTDEAKEYMRNELDSKGSGTKKPVSYYRQIEGVKYDRELLETAEGFVADGQISIAEARELWENAKDGAGVTATERRTLEHILKTMKCTAPAKKFLEKELAGVGTAPEHPEDKEDEGETKEEEKKEEEKETKATEDKPAPKPDVEEVDSDDEKPKPEKPKPMDVDSDDDKPKAEDKPEPMDVDKKSEDKKPEPAVDVEKTEKVEEKVVAVDTETKKTAVVEKAVAVEKKPEEPAKPAEPAKPEPKAEPPKPAVPAPVAPAPAAPSAAEIAAGKLEADREAKKKQKEAEARQRKAEKRKKLKDKKREAKKEEQKKNPVPPPPPKGKGGKGVKGKGKQVVPPKYQPKYVPKESFDDDIEIDYVVPEVLEGVDDESFKGVKEMFKIAEPEKEEEEGSEEEEEEKPKKRTRPKASLLDEAEDSDDDDDQPMSNKRRKLSSRMSVAELKTLVKRPDVVEVWDTTSIDPRLLVYLKAYRNTCAVPRHWSSKRKYMAGKRGVEKPPFKLPEYIEATGIAKIRQAIMDKQSEQSLRAKNRDKVHPKMGKLDIDYQVLHDAFFKYAKKPLLTKHNDMYYEGKEYEAKMMTKRPGQLSAALKEALGMSGEGAPPPWLINMQRYGPPPAYPSLKIPGLNAPIPQGAEYGYHPGGWGKPPVDEFGNPLYGDWRQEQAATPAAPQDTTLWGEVEDFDEEDDDDEAEGAEKDGMATPMLGTSTPLVGTGSATPVVSMEGGTRSISGVSSITSGMDTPGTGGTRSKRGGIASVSGVSSASLTPTPQLFQVLEEQKARGAKGMFPSQNQYKMKSRGGSTPIAGVGSSGTGTPIGGIGTPIGGIGTPHGIATPHGIGTPGMGTPGAGTRTPHGIGTRTPIGIGTPMSAAGGVGTHTPHGIGTHTPGIGTPIGGVGTPHVGGIATPVGGIATPVGGIATPVGGIATPVGGIATPVGGIATPVGGIATPTGGIATPAGIPAGMAPTPVGGADTPGPVTMSLNPQDVETEGILTADIIRQQLKQHEEAAAKAKLAAGQKEVEPRKVPVKEKKKKEKNKFKF